VAAAKKQKSLSDLFEDGVKDIYYAEKRIVKTLPKMAKAATDDALRAGLQKHLKETEGHIARLEKVFGLMGKTARGKTCPAIDGIIEEGGEVLDEFNGSPAIDAGLAASAQAVEHYEIARYRTLASWAHALGMGEAAALLEQTLDEEIAADEALVTMSQQGITERALDKAA
jgi:ferritin-like metal-binding protein YciE